MHDQSNREIILQDVSPQVFEAALGFLEDPLAARSMTFEEAVQVFEFYDKYEFLGGLRLCDQVFLEWFKDQPKLESEEDEKTPPEDVDLLVETMVLVEKHNLQKALQFGAKYMNERLHSTVVPFGCTMFTVEHVKQLQPLLAKGILEDGLKQGLSREEMDSSLYPEIFVHRRVLNSDRLGSLAVQGLSIQGSGCYADGGYGIDNTFCFARPVFYCRRYQEWEGMTLNFEVERNKSLGGLWTIVAVPMESNEAKIPLWKCPHSSNLPHPPREPWIPVHRLAYGKKPKITYVVE